MEYSTLKNIADDTEHQMNKLSDSNISMPAYI